MKRNAPSTPSSDHSSVCSGGAANIMNSRAVSAPYCSTSLCGSTPLFFDFDIVPMPPLSTGWPSAAQHGADARALLVHLHVHVGGVEVDDAARGRLAEVDVVQHHALRQQVGERLVDRHEPQVAHHARPEARVQQVQDGVLDAADVLVHRQPVVGALVDHRLVVAGAGDSGRSTTTSPRRCPSCPSRGAPRRRTSGRLHSRNAALLPSGLPLPSGTRSLGQHHRQLLVRHRHHAAGLAVDQRDRAAPVALARDAPVAQAPLHAALARALRLEELRRWRRWPRRTRARRTGRS